MWYWQDSSSQAPAELKPYGSFLESLRLATLERYIFLKDIAGLEEPPACISNSFLHGAVDFDAISWLQTVLIDNISCFQSGHTADSYNSLAENQEIFSIDKLMRRLRVYEEHYGLPLNSLGEEIMLMKRGGPVSKAWLMQKYHILNILNSFRMELAWGSRNSWTVRSYVSDSKTMIDFENRTSFQVQCEIFVEAYESWHDGPQRIYLLPWPLGNSSNSYSFSVTVPQAFVPVTGKMMPLFDSCRYWWPWGSWYVNPS